jgi:cerevisin
MRFSAIFATLAVVLAVSLDTALAAPSALREVERFAGQTTGKYIVKLKPGVSRKQWIQKLKLTSAVDWALVNGFASQSLDQP